MKELSYISLYKIAIGTLIPPYWDNVNLKIILWLTTIWYKKYIVVFFWPIPPSIFLDGITKLHWDFYYIRIIK